MSGESDSKSGAGGQFQMKRPIQAFAALDRLKGEQWIDVLLLSGFNLAANPFKGFNGKVIKIPIEDI